METFFRRVRGWVRVRTKVLFIHIFMHIPQRFFVSAPLYIRCFSEMAWVCRDLDRKFKAMSGKNAQERRWAFYRQVLNAEGLDQINYLEFGVASGGSFKWWLAHNQNRDSRFYGFDTFMGLPCRWNVFPAGMFSTGGVCPEVHDDRCFFIKGKFQDTLQRQVQDISFNRGVTVVHVDCDLFASAVYALNTLTPYFKKGDVIIFDEFCHPLDEFRAFKCFTESTQCTYDFLAFSNDWQQVALRLKSI